MTLRIKGYYSRGMGGAQGSVPKQIAPIAASGFPEIRSIHPATINVRFEPKLIVAGWDHRTPPIEWEPRRREVFDLLRVRLYFQNRPTDGLLYCAHGTPHRSDPHRHEFLAPWIAALVPDQEVFMECNHPYIELPYTDSRRGQRGPWLARTFVVLNAQGPTQ